MPDERLLAVVDDLHRPIRVEREQGAVELHREILPAAERTADAGEVDPHLLGLEPEARRDLVAVDVEPLGGDVDVDAALAVRHREARLWPEEGLILDADVVDARHHDLALRVGIAVRDHEVPDDVRSRVVAIAVPHRRPVFVERLDLGRPLHVGDDRELLVGDDDRLGRAARLLGVLGRDERDRLTVVADAIGGEHRLVGELEAVRLRAGNVVVGQDGVHAGQQERRAEIDLDDPRVRVRAPQRVAPEHPGAWRSLE